MIAFFDLDRTLLQVNTATLWVWYELRHGRISPRDALRAFAWIARYRFIGADIREAYGQAILMLQGVPAATLHDNTGDFYRRWVRGYERPGALKALKTHQARGEDCAILTSGSMFLATMVTAEWGLMPPLATRFEVDSSGYLTGQPEGVLCYGEGKVILAEAYARDRGVALSDCTFYTDSISDLPMLEAVGEPVVVNPDRALRSQAEGRGWPVLDWGRTTNLRTDLVRWAR